jgi:hypothetical protein
MPAFMPFITNGNSVEAVEKWETASDRLLSHTEGRWYILRRTEDQEGEHFYVILVLREEEARYRRVRDEAASGSSVCAKNGCTEDKVRRRTPCNPTANSSWRTTASIREGLWRMAELAQDAAEALEARIEDEDLDGRTQTVEVCETVKRLQALSLEVSEEWTPINDGTAVRKGRA